jgi:hypothetical protein
MGETRRVEAGAARQDLAGRGAVWQGLAWKARTARHGLRQAWRGRARCVGARHGVAWSGRRGMAGQGAAGLGAAWQGGARHGTAGGGKPWLGGEYVARSGSILTSLHREGCCRRGAPDVRTAGATEMRRVRHDGCGFMIARATLRNEDVT